MYAFKRSLPPRPWPCTIKIDRYMQRTSSGDNASHVKFIILYTFTRNGMAYAVAAIGIHCQFHRTVGWRVKRFTIYAMQFISFSASPTAPNDTLFNSNINFCFLLSSGTHHDSQLGLFSESIVMYCVCSCVLDCPFRTC